MEGPRGLRKNNKCGKVTWLTFCSGKSSLASVVLFSVSSFGSMKSVDVVLFSVSSFGSMKSVVVALLSISSFGSMKSVVVLVLFSVSLKAVRAWGGVLVLLIMLPVATNNMRKGRKNMCTSFSRCPVLTGEDSNFD